MKLDTRVCGDCLDVKVDVALAPTPPTCGGLLLNEVKMTCVGCGKSCRGTRCRKCFLKYMKSKEYKHKISVAALAAHANGAWKTKEWRQKQSQIQKIAQNKSEVKHKKSRGARVAHKRGNYGAAWRQKLSKTHNIPEIKKRQSKAIAAAHARGCYKDAHQKRSKTMKAVWKRKKTHGIEEWRRTAVEVQNRPEVRAKKSAALKGEKSPNWLGGVSFMPYSPNWYETRKTVLERDGYECVICGLSGSKRNCPVHHIDYNKKNDRLTNLVALCERHHAQTTAGDRSFWQSYFEGQVYLAMGVC